MCSRHPTHGEPIPTAMTIDVADSSWDTRATCAAKILFSMGGGSIQTGCCYGLDPGYLGSLGYASREEGEEESRESRAEILRF